MMNNVGDHAQLPEVRNSIGADLSTNEAARDIAWRAFKGNEHVKRAAEVAMLGKHSITLLGRPGNGQTCLQAAISSDCGPVTCVALCRCGNHLEPSVECTCTATEIRHYQNTKRFQRALTSDIVVQIVTPTTRDLLGDAGEPLHAVLTRVARARFAVVSTELDHSARALLETAQRRLGFTAEQVTRVLRVAASIARLDHATTRAACHVAEAVQYQSMLNRSCNQ